MKLRRKEMQILSIVLAGWGSILIGNGISMMQGKETLTKINYKLNITTKQISEVQAKKNEIIPKDITIEEGKPISGNIKDYLVDADQVADDMLQQLSQGLDTSNVNINKPGTYTYTISYKKKIFQGKITVEAKELPKVTITLKSKKLPTTGTLSRNIKDYVYEEENMTEEVYNNMILDLEEVAAHLSTPGKYKYRVIYNDTTYYGDFDIFEPVSTGNSEIVCPTDATKENNSCKCSDETKEYDTASKTCKTKEN